MKNRNLRLYILLLVLCFSGAAGLMNQVVWQRALKVFFGGSETISSMIVVLVFLAGLGVGSKWIGERMRSIEWPTRTLATIELLLAVTNFLVCQLLSLNPTESIYFFQKTAITLGFPLRLVYALGATLLLAAPCFLMGTTLPLAAHVCQTDLELNESRFVNRLYAVNTFGSVLGALAGLGSFVPRYGQRLTLVFAAALNLLAATILFFMSQPATTPGLAVKREDPSEPSVRGADFRFDGFIILAFGFGFCALWYEMFLYRAIALRHEPLPLVFSAVLTGFLFFWSLGTIASSFKSWTIHLTYIIFGCILSALGAILFYVYERVSFPLDTTWNEIVFILTNFPYFLPCFFFGLLFGLTLEKAIRLWGRDVGRLNAWNTVGSCGGILVATFLGYELNLLWMLAVQWLLLFALGGISDKIRDTYFEKKSPLRGSYSAMFWLRNTPTVFFSLLALLMLLSGLLIRPVAGKDGSISLFGRDGVIMIDQHRNLIWDGLWHSRLSLNNDHIGTYNWGLAVDPILAHPTGVIREALVVGLGSGITVATLAKYESIRNVDVYDINQTLKGVLTRYPEGTLHVAESPKIRIIWQDGRSGLALNDKKYDLITQQPLYLRQAGASLLLSKEYFQLVSKRLNADGVFCVYANGTPEQALAVRQTAAEVFPCMLVFHQGYSLVLSNSSLDSFQDRLETLISQEGELWEEVRQFREMVGRDQWNTYIKPCHLALAGSKLSIRDDFPIVEYPWHLKKLLLEVHFTSNLPLPGFNWRPR